MTTGGYRTLQDSRNSSQNPTFWKNVWDPLALPKLNLFFWTLAHNKVLTRDNMEKMNIAGPHRCVLCSNNSEISQHLFLECKFSKEVWNIILHNFQITLPSQTSVADLYATWNSIYPQCIPPKSIWKKMDSYPKVCVLAALASSKSTDF